MNGWSRSLLIVTAVVGLVAEVSAIQAYSISGDQVSRLLQLDRSSFDHQLSMPEVFSREADVRLKVESKARNRNRVRIRVGCMKRQDCVPFFVDVRFLTVEQAQLFADRTDAATRHREKEAPMLVRRNSLARLDVVTSGGKLQFYVRCLQSGAEGDVISARDEETHKVYSAKVVDANRLRFEQ